MKIIGWDIGGAHIKASKVDFKKKKIKCYQEFCPSWLSLKNLKKSIISVKKKMGNCNYHAVTMTAELVDIFDSRKDGCKKIINLFCKLFPKKKIFFYRRKKKIPFLNKKKALSNTRSIFSMNWYASAKFISQFFSNCIVIDIGSSTTDIVPIKNGKIVAKSYKDSARLANNELVYFGVIRTPITSITKYLKYKKKKQRLIHENFSNLGDVYRLLGKLPKKFDLSPTCDNKAKSKEASARRIARIFGKDYNDANLNVWKDIASKIEKKQKKEIKILIKKVEEKVFKKKIPIIGLGSGEFLLKEIFSKKRNYKSFYKIFKKNKKRKKIENCEAAISTAYLLHNTLDGTTSKF